MKKIIISVLVACVSLMAAEGAQADKSWGVKADGKKLFEQRCALCHGKDATKVPAEGIAPLAGRDVVRLALRIRSYRDQSDDIGSYTMHKDSQLMKDATAGLSREGIVAIAKYINTLK